MKNQLVRTSGFLSVLAAALLSACGGGGSQIESSAGPSTKEVAVVAGNSAEVPGQVKTETNLLKSVTWVATPASADVKLTNQDCAVAIKNDTKFVPPAGFTGTRTGASDWSCALGVKTAENKAVFEEKTYSLSIVGTDDMGRTQTDTTSLRVKPYFSKVAGFSDYTYKKAANLADLQGSWVNGSADSNALEAVANDVALTVNADGSFRGTSKGCAFTGLAIPGDTENVFRTNVTFGGAPCVFENQTLSGASVGFTSGGGKKLIAYVEDAKKENWMSFVGKR